MQTTGIAKDLQHLREQAQVLSSLIFSLQGQVAAADHSAPMGQRIQQDTASVHIVWAEVEQSIVGIAETIEYLKELSDTQAIAELRHALSASYCE